MKKLLFLLAVLVLPIFGHAQNVRYDAPWPSISSTTSTPFLVANVPPNSPIIAVCQHPANQTPCTNYATTYNSVGAACPNGAQDTPQPQPSSCQVTGDAQGNIGFWAPAGTYDYTVTISNQSFGPYTVTLGGQGGGGGGLGDPGSNSIPFRFAPNFTQPATAANITGLFTGCSGTLVLAANGTCVPIPSAGSTIPFGLVVTSNSISNLACNGASSDTAAWRALTAGIGSTPTSLIFPNSGTCQLGDVTSPPNITVDYSPGGSIAPITSSTSAGGGSFVAEASCNNAASASCASTFSGSVTAHDTLLEMCIRYPGFNGGFVVSSVTDNVGDSFTKVSQSLINQSSNVDAWLASDTPGSGALTVTANISGSSRNACKVWDISGLGPIVVADGAGSSSNGGSTTMTSGAATFQAGTFVVGFGGQSQTTETCTAGAGFTMPAGCVGTGQALGAEYIASASAGSSTATMTLGTTPAAFWAFAQLGLRPGSATINIQGCMIAPAQQVFYNAAGQGTIDFTNNACVTGIKPEWWGASASASATTNTAALQAAIHGAFGYNRTNSSGLKIWNKPLLLSQNYSINGELQLYSVNSGIIQGTGRLVSGITQTASNQRIFDAQSVSYSAFNDFFLGTSASQDATHPLFDLDWNGISTKNDSPNQFDDLTRLSFVGNTLAAVGFQLSKSGGAAQGSNINCWDCSLSGFTTAAYRIGTPTAYAQNALGDLFIQGDIQGSPGYGIAVYGGTIKVEGGTTMENGFSTQTGFDFYCEAPQYPCELDDMRSEGRRLAAGNPIIIRNSKTLNQAVFPAPGTTQPVGTILSGSAVPPNGGRYYRVTVDSSAFGGFGTPTSTTLASAGSATTISDTNQTVAGSVTTGTFVLGETLTQGTTGSTATLLNAVTSVSTITGSVTSGVFTFGETVTQASTGVTATLQAPTPNGSLSMLVKGLSGTADSSHIWTGGTSGATYTPTSIPVASVSNPAMLITAASGSPDSSHTWVGGSSGAVYTPTGAPAGIGWSSNAFASFTASIITGTCAGYYGVISSNTTTAITVASWLTSFNQIPVCPAPDTTSAFIVEPTWGTQTVSGGITWADLNETGIEGGLGFGLGTALLDTVDVPGDKISIGAGSNVRLHNVTTSRTDWATLPAGNYLNSWPRITNDIDVFDSRGIGNGAATYYKSFSLPRTGGGPYLGDTQENLGTKALVWSQGNPSGTATNDVWIGGRSDMGAGTSASRNILEYGGILGRASAYGTNQNGTATTIQGGLPTGSGTPGNIEFWECPTGGSSSASICPNAAKVASVDPNGFEGPIGIGTPLAAAHSNLSLTQYLSTVAIANASSTGTTLASLAKVTGAPSKAVIAATTDTNGIIGIVVTGAGTTGNAGIATNGVASCTFDGATTAGDYVQISSSTGGDCHDAGSTFPATNQVLGIVLQSIGSTGPAGVILGTDIEGGQLTGSSTLAGLTDVSLSAPSGGQCLVYNSGTTKWNNNACAAAGAAFQVNGVGLSSIGTINYQDSAATNGVTYHFTNPSAGNVQLTVTGALTLAGGGLGITSGTSGGVPYFASASTVASSAALNATQLVLGGGAGSPPVSGNLSGDVATSGSTATTIQPNAVTSAKMAVVNTYRVCGMVFGSDNPSGAVLASADIAPQVSQCFIPAAATVIEVDVYGDAGASSVTVARNRGGSVTALTSSQLASAAAGARACSNAGGTAGLGSGAPTCSGTLSTTALAAGDTLQTAAATADGVSRSLKVFVTFTIN